MELLGHPEASIQKVGDNGVFIRTTMLKQAGELDTSKSEQEIILETLGKVAAIETIEVDTLLKIKKVFLVKF